MCIKGEDRGTSFFSLGIRGAIGTLKLASTLISAEPRQVYEYEAEVKVERLFLETTNDVTLGIPFQWTWPGLYVQDWMFLQSGVGLYT
jgi:hypothetical protein